MHFNIYHVRPIKFLVAFFTLLFSAEEFLMDNCSREQKSSSDSSQLITGNRTAHFALLPMRGTSTDTAQFTLPTQLHCINSLIANSYLINITGSQTKGGGAIPSPILEHLQWKSSHSMEKFTYKMQ